MKKLLFIAFLLIPLNLIAQTIPDQKILGADVIYSKGELVPLGISPIISNPDNLDQVLYTWNVRDPDVPNKSFKDFGNGEVIFGAGSTDHTIDVECVVTYLYLIKDKDVIKSVSVRTKILTAKIQIGLLPKPKPEPNPELPSTNSLATDYLTSYRTALYNAAKSLRANSASLINGTKNIKDIRDAMLVEWANARSQAFDKYYKSTLIGIIPEGATTVTPDQIERYAKALEAIGDSVIK